MEEEKQHRTVFSLLTHPVFTPHPDIAWDILSYCYEPKLLYLLMTTDTEVMASCIPRAMEFENFVKSHILAGSRSTTSPTPSSAASSAASSR